jgi:adenylate kinase
MKYLSECDLIIYDLHSGNPEDVKLGLEALRKHKFEEEKTLILISSLMAWMGTPKKVEVVKSAEELEAEKERGAGKDKGEEEKEEKEEQDEEEGDEEREEEVNEVQEEGQQELDMYENDSDIPLNMKPKNRKQFVHLPFTEQDYKLRNPVQEYQIIKEIEDEVLNFKKEGVKTYVISAGILYGKGEAIFNQHIKKAWLQDPPRLQYIGDGDNLLPTIHVTDLARIVKKVFEAKPQRKYIFAVDNNKKREQRKLISAISNGIGTGLIESVDIPETFKVAHPKLTPIQLDLDWKKSLLLDLKVTPSSLFIKGEKATKAEGDEEEEAEEGGEEVLEMDWHCKAGLAQNIQRVKEEFEKERGLRPIKILISGYPCSGKSFFGQKLAEHYNIPHIHMEKLISDLKEWDKEKEDRYKLAVAKRDAKLKELLAQQERDKSN